MYTARISEIVNRILSEVYTDVLDNDEYLDRGIECYENTAKGIKAKLKDVDRRKPPENRENPGGDAMVVKFYENEGEDYFGYWD